MTSLAVFQRQCKCRFVVGVFFWSRINLPPLNWMRLARLNHRGWRVFLVHLSLMTGQRSGWRGNRAGKFSTLLGLLWLRVSVIYPQRNNYSLSLPFNATVQCTELFQQRRWLKLLMTSHFFFFFFWRRRQIEWHRKWQNYRISLGSFIISQKRGRKQVFISSAIWDSTSSYRAQSRQSDRINVSAQKLLYGNIGWARLVSLRAYCLERVSRQGGIPGNNNNNVAYDKDGGTEIGINHSGCFRGFSFFFFRCEM